MNAPARPAWRLPYRRAGIVYLLAILVPTLALCYLGLSAIGRERGAAEQLAAANAVLMAERLMNEVEARATTLAERCLREAGTVGSNAAAAADSPLVRHTVRTSLDRVRARHPIARALVVFRGNALLVPQPATQLPRRIDQVLEGEPRILRAQFDSLFAQADLQEARAVQPGSVRPIYQRAFDLPVSNQLRGLALAGVARCARKSGDLAGALLAYRILISQFSDQYDLSNTPYGITAALALDELDRGRQTSRTATLSAVLTDLSNGRWEVDADTAKYFQQVLSERIGQVRTPPPSSYIDYLSLADRLQMHARPPGVAKTGDIVPVALNGEGEAGQVFYLQSEGEFGSAHSLVIGMVVDLAWVAKDLLPSVARDLKVPSNHRLLRQPASLPSQAGGSAAAVVPFRTVFRFWSVEVPPASIAEPGAVWLFAGTTLAVLAVLLLGVVLLVRDASREASLARLRSGFVSGVSHELKTPLTLIRMYGEMLQDDPDAPADERQIYSGIITRESQRLTRLIDRVLDFSRAERGARKYRLALVSLAPVLQATLDEYVPYLEQKGFVLEQQLGEVAPVNADADAVREAIVNLLDNATKYSGDSRHITVRLVARVGEAVAEVRDRGIGLDDRTRAHLFKPFARGEHGDGTGGHGLGLYLVKHIMDAHAGRVEVDTAAGEGSCFRLVFPALSSRTDGTAQIQE